MKTPTFLLLFCLVLTASCKDRPAENAGERISMPGNIEVYNPYMGTDLLNPLDEKAALRIYTLIDVSCSPCFLKLEKWNNLRAEMKGMKPVSLIPVCYSKDGFEMIRYLFENDKIPRIQFPLVFDLDDNFRKQNPGLVNQLGELTALTDNNNNILLMGNPIENKDDKDKFFKAIAKTN